MHLTHFQYNNNCILYSETVRQHSHLIGKIRWVFWSTTSFRYIEIWFKSFPPIRIRNSTAKAKQLMMLQSDISEKGRKNDVLNVYTNETTASNYQELREFKTTETYDTPKDKKNCNWMMWINIKETKGVVMHRFMKTFM